MGSRTKQSWFNPRKVTDSSFLQASRLVLGPLQLNCGTAAWARSQPLTPSSTNVKNEWSYTSTSPYAFMPNTDTDYHTGRTLPSFPLITVIKKCLKIQTSLLFTQTSINKTEPPFRLLTASVGMGTFLIGNMLQIKNILVTFKYQELVANCVSLTIQCKCTLICVCTLLSSCSFVALALNKVPFSSTYSFHAAHILLHIFYQLEGIISSVLFSAVRYCPPQLRQKQL